LGWSGGAGHPIEAVKHPGRQAAPQPDESHYPDPLNEIGKEREMADILGWIEARLPC
jgi:hypothetical protein